MTATEPWEFLNQFIVLDDRQAEVLLAAIEQAAPGLLVSDVAERVANASGLPEHEVEDLLFMLSRIARSRGQDSLDNFVDAVLGEFSLEEVASGHEIDWKRAKARLTRALATPAIQVTSKALQVVGDHARLFCTARILSDIRPVFSDEPLDAQGLVITHQLKIAYHEERGDEAKELFVAMDRHDILELKGALERALAIHERLVEMAEKLELPLLGGRNR